MVIVWLDLLPHRTTVNLLAAKDLVLGLNRNTCTEPLLHGKSSRHMAECSAGTRNTPKRWVLVWVLRRNFLWDYVFWVRIFLINSSCQNLTQLLTYYINQNLMVWVFANISRWRAFGFQIHAEAKKEIQIFCYFLINQSGNIRLYSLLHIWRASNLYFKCKVRIDHIPIIKILSFERMHHVMFFHHYIYDKCQRFGSPINEKHSISFTMKEAALFLLINTKDDPS